MSFELALPFILKLEGGYSNNPNDSGGATNKGITQDVYNNYLSSIHLPDADVRSITMDEVSEIYKQNYWIDGHCDKLPVGVAMIHFDFCVNAGISQAAKILQRVLMINDAAVKDDGIIGPITIKAAFDMDQIKLIKSYSDARSAFYHMLVLRKPKNSEFLKSWLNRTNYIEAKALAALPGEGMNGL